MGTFNVELHAGDQQGERFEAVEALVDTGSTYTVLPGAMLRALGVLPHRTSTFELADGTQHEWEIARTWVKLEGRQEMTLVVFGEDDVQPLLGAATSEEFLLAPDPIRQRLVPVHGLAMSVFHV